MPGGFIRRVHALFPGNTHYLATDLELGTCVAFWQNTRRIMPMTFCFFAAPKASLSNDKPDPRSCLRWLLKLGCSVFVLLLVLGCSQSSSPPEPSPNSPSLSAESPAFRLYWQGKKRLAGEANATNFMAIWKMPESEKLESQTLDKLSTAPWRLLPTATSLSNAPVALLRP